MEKPIQDLSALRHAVIEGDVPASVTAARTALEEGVQPIDVISQGISPAMAEVG